MSETRLGSATSNPTTAVPPSMCTITSGDPPATSPHDRAANAAAQAPVPHASVMPAPRSWTRIVIAGGLGTGLDDLEVDVGHLAPEFEQIDDADLVDTDDAVRIAQAEVHDGAIGMATQRRPAGGFRKGRHSAHVDPSGDRGRVGGRRHRDGAVAGIGQDQLVGQTCRDRWPAPGRSNGCRCRSSRPANRRR